MLKLNLQRFAQDELLGTWVFNNTLNIDLKETIYNLSFTTNGYHYTFISINGLNDEGMIIKVMGFYNSPIEILNVYRDIDGSIRWEEETYKTIEITDTSKLTNREAFTTWLKANATKIAEPVSKIDDNYNNLATKDDLERYQPRLREGTNITIDEDGTINAKGGTIDNNVTFIKTDGTGVGLQSAQLYGTPKGQAETTIYPIAKTTDLIADDEYSPFVDKTDEDKQVAMDTNGKLWYKSGGGSANGVRYEEIISDELIGTWVFEGDGGHIKTTYITFQVDFKSNGLNYNSIKIIEAFGGNGELYYDNTQVCDLSAQSEGGPDFVLTWRDISFSTIEITDTSSLTNREAFTTWLKANATKQ